MTDRTIRVGFVGAGANTRRHHIPKLRTQPGIELVAVANRTKESGERVAREFGVARVYGEWRELVRAPDIDAVCIGTWPDTAHARCRAPHLVAQLVPAPNTLEIDPTLNAIRGREKVSRTTFEDGVRYMEFTEAVWKSAASGQAVDVAEL